MPISETELRQIILDVWSCTLGLPLEGPEPGDPGIGDSALAARVRISGFWELTLFLRCRREVAHRWASVMFNRKTAETSQEDVRDALGELANMVAGNVKGLLPGQFQLSLPVVADWYPPEGPRTGQVVAATRFRCEGDPLHIFLLAVTPAASSPQ